MRGEGNGGAGDGSEVPGFHSFMDGDVFAGIGMTQSTGWFNSHGTYGGDVKYAVGCMEVIRHSGLEIQLESLSTGLT